ARVGRRRGRAQRTCPGALLARPRRRQPAGPGTPWSHATRLAQDLHPPAGLHRTARPGAASARAPGCDAARRAHARRALLHHRRSGGHPMAHRTLDRIADAVTRWPVARQLSQLGMDGAAVSGRTRAQHSRLRDVTTVSSVCPFCAVGCGTLVHVRDGRVVDIEGNPESPINEGTLCPKGASTFQYTINPHRLTKVLHRRPYAAAWEELDLDEAMERVAQLFKETRDRTWVETHSDGETEGPARHTTS